jgi:hypothetical protein
LSVLFLSSNLLYYLFVSHNLELWNSLGSCHVECGISAHAWFIYLFIYLLFLVRLGFELRVLCLHSSLCSIWATPPDHFALVILEMGVSQTIFLD